LSALATIEKSGTQKRPKPASLGSPEAASPAQRMRATVVLSSLLVAFAALGGRLYNVQVRDHDHYAQVARKQQQRIRAILPWRGNVYALEDGKPVVIASSLARGSLLVERKEERDDERFMEKLERALELTPGERAFVQEKLAKDAPFFFRRRKLTADDMEKLRAARLEAAQVLEEPVRAYPFGPFAVQTLGLLSADGEGVSGIEKAFEEQLRGVRGLREVELDNRHRELVDEASVEVDAREGLSVVTTIDRRIQAIVEEELDAIVATWQPEGAACVVVDPHTGNILAMASRPTFSPESLAGVAPAAYKNRALCERYEPGSTIKSIIVGTAWDKGLGDPERRISCPRVWHLENRKKSIEDHHEVGDTNEAGVLVQSSNVGAVQIGSRLGMANIRRALETFGLGRVSGLELPGEATGNIRNLAKTDATTLGSICQGYAFNVTPLQMALAYGAIANGGTLYRPRIVLELRNGAGETTRRFEPQPVARVLSNHVAKDWLAPALERVVSDKEGTAHACKVPGYTLAGKTGTTKKIVDGHYSERECVTSFCGFAPYDEPRIAFSVVVFSPSTAKGKVWGGTVAAPAASAITGKALKYLGVPPTIEMKAEATPGEK
jgi:cell division protein FtsI (penicillin-binding protein 3)